MDINLSNIFQYVVPSIIAGLFMAIVGVIPYFISKRESPKDRSESDKNAVETAKMLYEGLALRVSQLESENANLRKQHDILRKDNAYTADLQITKYELESQVSELTGRINSLERSLKAVMDAVREYIKNPENNVSLDKLLVDIEGQLKL